MMRSQLGSDTDAELGEGAVLKSSLVPLSSLSRQECRGPCPSAETLHNSFQASAVAAQKGQRLAQQLHEQLQWDARVTRHDAVLAQRIQRMDERSWQVEPQSQAVALQPAMHVWGRVGPLQLSPAAPFGAQEIGDHVEEPFRGPPPPPVIELDMEDDDVEETLTLLPSSCAAGGSAAAGLAGRPAVAQQPPSKRLMPAPTQQAAEPWAERPGKRLQPNQPLVTCGSCLEEFAAWEVSRAGSGAGADGGPSTSAAAAATGCEHAFCEACMRSYVQVGPRAVSARERPEQ
jgi:hypothetical protein